MQHGEYGIHLVFAYPACTLEELGKKFNSEGGSDLPATTKGELIELCKTNYTYHGCHSKFLTEKCGRDAASVLRAILAPSLDNL